VQAESSPQTLEVPRVSLSFGTSGTRALPQKGADWSHFRRFCNSALPFVKSQFSGPVYCLAKMTDGWVFDLSSSTI
jgi:hypothetical protein